MGDAHVPGQVGDALPVGEDLGGHAVALALVDPAALRNGDACRILASLSRASVPGLGPRCPRQLAGEPAGEGIVGGLTCWRK